MGRPQVLSDGLILSHEADDLVVMYRPRAGSPPSTSIRHLSHGVRSASKDGWGSIGYDPGYVQPLQLRPLPGRDPAHLRGQSRRSRQSAAAARDFPRPDGARGPRADGERVLTMMRWGFPPPLKVGTQLVTNVRNVASPYWRPWLKPAHRCLVPVTAFSEYGDTKPRKTPLKSPIYKSRLHMKARRQTHRQRALFPRQ